MRTFTALLVDDELAGLRTLEAKIEWSNFPIKIIGKVNSVQRAIPIILEFKPDLVFLDIKMPEQDGFSLFAF
jgi:YesN/AraC family two-component response regulator